MLKYFTQTIGLLVCMIALLSCERMQREEQATSTPKDTTEVYLQTMRSLDEYSEKLQLLIKSDTGVLRGVRFNEPLSEVLRIEETKVFEKKDSVLTLELDLDSTEVADVTYGLDSLEKVQDIRIELYLKDDRSLNTLATEFVDYFSSKYGPSKQVSPQHYVWALPRNRLMNLKIIKEGIDRGIVLHAQ